MPDMEFWTWISSEPTGIADFARRAEAHGWDGIGLGDSQSLTGDPYVCLALAATVTDTLGLATAVTNSITRHASVTATSVFTVQRLSRGRMVVGIGRGDSALAHLGRAPARLKWFETYLEQLQTYLAGGEVNFEESNIPDEAAPPVDRISLAKAPETSSICWVGDEPNEPKVPVEVVATGPRVIGIAARQADRVMLAVGADPKRIAWGIQTAREAARRAGRDIDSIRFGAYVNVICGDDPAVSRELGRPSTGLFARFSAMYGEVAGPVDDSQVEVFRRLHDCYDMTEHGQQGGQQAMALTDDFIDRYAIIGSPEYCADKLTDLRKLGVTKFAIIGPNFVMSTPEAEAAAARFTGEVLPLLRR
ncbi:MAG: LLM class flavin-dependent oxidoreductase [Nitrosopumilaceae archaeon]|nr:LLM class flavin-dependent oxidoreductase [Nitrosopumilaceae archaeon]